MYRQPVLDILFRSAQILQDNLPCDQVPLLIRSRQGVLVEVVDGVDPTLVLDVVLPLDRLLEGALRDIDLCGAVSVYPPCPPNAWLSSLVPLPRLLVLVRIPAP